MHVILCSAVPIGALTEAVFFKNACDLAVERDGIGILTGLPMAANRFARIRIIIIILLGVDVDGAADGML